MNSNLPKLLWTGRFTSGSIIVSDISKYSIIACHVEGGIICIGSLNYGLGGMVQYGALATNNTYGYRFAISGDTITIDSNNKGAVGDGVSKTITAIWGIV